ncbi:hypothetical protein BJ944DRAFT_230767 [Cunninghamella echinulata]|nr:hypothetical protein BJ944DRAFT_230767 [Cunninghamella echinulata]
MPHKRAKASVRKERSKMVDLPATKSDMGQDGPKGLARLLKMKDYMKENNKKKQQQKKEAAEAKKALTKIQPGERLGDFARRVEKEYQSEMVAAHKESKPITERKKKNQLARKEKSKAKKQKIIEKYGGKDFDDLKDDVKFGEVVDAPPIFKKLPKARGQGKQELEAKTKEMLVSSSSKKRKLDQDNNDTTTTNGYESEEDENMKLLKASHKRKLANMSAAAKKILEDEREKAISLYREKKSKKMADSGLTPSYNL